MCTLRQWAGLRVHTYSFPVLEYCSRLCSVLEQASSCVYILSSFGRVGGIYTSCVGQWEKVRRLCRTHTLLLHPSSSLLQISIPPIIFQSLSCLRHSFFSIIFSTRYLFYPSNMVLFFFFHFFLFPQSYFNSCLPFKFLFVPSLLSFGPGLFIYSPIKSHPPSLYLF